LVWRLAWRFDYRLNFKIGELFAESVEEPVVRGEFLSVFILDNKENVHLD
jgi:hypothetical protein